MTEFYIYRKTQRFLFLTKTMKQMKFLMGLEYMRVKFRYYFYLANEWKGQVRRQQSSSNLPGLRASTIRLPSFSYMD